MPQPTAACSPLNATPSPGSLGLHRSSEAGGYSFESPLFVQCYSEEVEAVPSLGVGDSSPRRKVAFAAIVYFGEPISQRQRQTPAF